MTTQQIRALLIEDNPGDARLIEMALSETRAAFFQLEKVERLSDGLERLAAGGIDVLLLDLSLPDSHGIETFERVAAEAPGVPIVVLSGMSDEQLGARAVNAGAQDYLVKGRGDGESLARAILYALERHELQRELRRLALDDELTGLNNRRGFMTLGEAAIRSAHRSGSTMTLLFVDLNEMKTINDRLGHQEGDRALVDVARILRQTFRESDIVARVGGDEFCALLIGNTPESNGPVARLHAKIDEFNISATRPYRLSLSIGAHVYDPAEPCTLDAMIEEADRLMYREKMGAERRHRLLVVDDDPSIRRLAEVVFADDYDVVLAATGGEASALVSNGRFDLILLDMRLPDMPGTDVVRQMRGDPSTSGTPIIIMTGVQDASTELESLKLGIADFVRKPFDPAILVTRVENAIARTRRR
jgi:two-component system cell cycle response regulator